MTRLTASLVAAAVLPLAGSALAGGDGWITDMDEAMAIAKAENKTILMDFTGSDWCGWCIRLDKEVFSQSLFKEYAAENLVLVELDFPRNVEQTDEQKAHNEKWRDKVGIEGYPTIILADANGDEFARTGYRPDGPAPYADHLGSLLKGKSIRDAALAAADKVTGIARAKLLDWALTLEGISIPNSDKLMAEIIELDADDLAGLKSIYQNKFNDMMVDEGFQKVQEAAFQGDTESAMKALDELEAKYTMSAAKAGELAGFRVMMLGMSGDVDKAVETLEAYMAGAAENEAKQQVAAAGINVYLSAQRFEDAIAIFEKVIELGPDTEMGKMMGESRQQFMDYVDKMKNDTLESIPATKLVDPGEDG